MKFPKFENDGGKGGGASSSTFLKLKDGDRVRAVFRGDPYSYWSHWAGKTVPCKGRATCELCKNGDKAKTRFHINVLVEQDGVWVAKIFEGGYGMLKDMAKLHDEYNLEETVMWLSRSGEKMDTEWSLIPAKNNGGLSKEDMTRFGGIPLNALGPKSETPKAS